MFKSGEMRFVILRLVREKPRHGYEVMKALEEKFRAHYTPSAGTVYPTLQMLEDEGFVRARRHRGEEDLSRHSREVSSTSTSAGMSWTRSRASPGNGARLHRRRAGRGAGRIRAPGGATFRRAWRLGPDDLALERVAEILKKAAEEIDEAWRAGSPGTTEPRCEPSTERVSGQVSHRRLPRRHMFVSRTTEFVAVHIDVVAGHIAIRERELA